MGLFKRWSVNLVFILAGLVYLLGLMVEIFDVDSAQYAAISREMLEGGSFLEVFQQGNDYLDKPPFLFWINAFFFYLFGYTPWAFKLGSLLFSAVGVIATYKLGNLLYNKRIGFVAAIMLMSSLAFVLMNNDVRTDTILTSAVVISVWKLTAYLYYKKKRDLVYGFIAMAIAMMTKGPIGLVIPLMALGSYTIGRHKYKDLFRWDWVMGLGIVAILMIPMSYGLYHQFDAHPEKVVSFPTPEGLVKYDNVSGLKFFYWDQSFGRITGDNPWHNNAGPLFFVHTFLWSFFPWSLLAVWAFFWRIVVAINNVIKKEKKQEWLTLGGFLLPFLALSLSQYKLPHYIYVVMPFAAIFTSEFMMRIALEKTRVWYNAAVVIQAINVLIIAALYVLIGAFVFPDTAWYWWIVGVAGFGLSLYFFFSKSHLNRLVLTSIFSALTAYLFVNGNYFPKLSEFQPTEEVAADLRELGVDEDHLFVQLPKGTFSMAYETGFILNRINNSVLDTVSFLPNTYAYSEQKGLNLLTEHGYEYEVIKSYKQFPVTQVNGTFLNAKTREESLNTTFLVKIINKQ